MGVHRIRHENIVRLLGAGKDPERFLIIARLDGGTLGQRCDHGSRLRDRRGRFKGQQPFSHMEVCECVFVCVCLYVCMCFLYEFRPR